MKKLLLAIALTGCTSLEIPPPTSVIGQKIALKIESQQLYEKPIPFVRSSRLIKIAFFRSDNVCPWSKNENIKKTYLFTVNMDNKTPTKSIEIPLAGKNDKIYALITDFNGATTCPQNISFTPANGFHYYMDIYAHLNPASRCKSKLYKLIADIKQEEESFRWTGPKTPLMGIYSQNAICDI